MPDLADLRDALANAVCEAGEMVTKYVTIAEVMDADGGFQLRYATDGVTPWDAVGMLSIAADAYANGDTEDD